MESLGGIEPWVEVNLVAAVGVDEGLLVNAVAPVIDEVRDLIEVWFFFWEPHLRLRLRWRSLIAEEMGRPLLIARLDAATKAGELLSWYEGAHGVRGRTYHGEAALYGTEMWETVQRDWMNGSEFALAVASFSRAGSLTKGRAFHWARHVHLFTNQTFPSYEAEARLCLHQARDYLARLQLHSAPRAAEVGDLVRSIDAFLTSRDQG